MNEPDEIIYNHCKRHDSVSIRFNGKVKTLTEWANYLKMNPSTLRGRILDLRWPIYDAFTTPLEKRRKR